MNDNKDAVAAVCLRNGVMNQRRKWLLNRRQPAQNNPPSLRNTKHMEKQMCSVELEMKKSSCSKLNTNAQQAKLVCNCVWNDNLILMTEPSLGCFY